MKGWEAGNLESRVFNHWEFSIIAVNGFTFFLVLFDRLFCRPRFLLGSTWI